MSKCVGYQEFRSHVLYFFVFGNMSSVIHSLAPTTQPSPIVTRQRIVALAYITTLSSIMGCLGMPFIGFPFSSSGKLFAPSVTP